MSKEERRGVIALKQENARLAKEGSALTGKAIAEQRSMTGAETQRSMDIMVKMAENQKAIDSIESTRRQVLGEVRGNRGGDIHGTPEYRQYLEWMGAELRDIASGSFGGALVPLDYQQTVWDRLRPASVFLSTNPTVITTDRHEISLPHLTADAAASWVAEAGSISETDPTGEDITVTPSKVAALTKISRESADDSNPGVVDVIMKNLTQSIGLAVDLAAFQGTGSSNQPTGLKNTSGISLDNTTMGTNGSAFTNLDPILTALGTLEGNNANMDKAVIVMHSRSWAELTKLKDSQNRYLLSSVQNGDAPARSIDGVPVFISNQLSITETQGSANTASSVYVYDASQVIVVRREALRLEATQDAFFSNDQIGLRGIARVGFAVPNPLAVVRLAGVL